MSKIDKWEFPSLHSSFRALRIIPPDDRHRDRTRRINLISKRIIISNIPYEMKWQDIKDIFRKEGMFFFGLGLKIENRGTQSVTILTMDTQTRLPLLFKIKAKVTFIQIFKSLPEI
jgi:RNA recognition motif-containing protein